MVWSGARRNSPGNFFRQGRANDFHVVLLEKRLVCGGIRIPNLICGQLLEVFRERFQMSCWLSDDEHLAWCRADVVPRVRDELGSIDARARRQMEHLVAYLDVVLAFQ